MKKFVFKCIATVVALTTLCTSVLAAAPYTVTEDFVNNEITVTGTGAEAENVIFQILKKGKSFDDWTSGSSLSDFVLWQKQITIDGTKAYTFTVPYANTLEAGEYEFRVVSDLSGVLESEESPLALVGTTTYSNELAEIKTQALADTADIAEVEYAIDGGDGSVSPVGFDLAIFNELSPTVKTKAIKNYLAYVADGVNGGLADFAADKHFASANMANRSANFNTYMIMAALDEGGIIDDLVVALEDSSLAVDEAELLADLEDCVVYDYEWNYVISKLEAADGIVDAKSLRQAIVEALILCETRYSDGSDISWVLSNLGYGEDIEIANPTTNKKVYAAMNGKDYEDIEAFKEAYRGFVREFSKGSDGGSGGSTAPSHWAGKYEEESTASTNKESIKVPYVDIEGIVWAADAIIALTDMGVLNGKGNGYFEPDSSVTREEFVKILVAALGYENAGYAGNNFGDVADSDWFCKYVNIAYEKGLVNGIGGGLFGVGQELTRQDMVVMLYNALTASGAQLATGEATFADDHKIADYAKTAVNALYTMGVVNGVSDTEFDPLGIASRAQAAKVVYGVLKMLK